MSTSAEFPPRAMLVLAGEQLWPNVHGLVHWARAGGLTDLCIYHTADAARSARPAQRLAALCRTLFKTVDVHLPNEGLGIRPEDVQEQVRRWRVELPGRRWVINATGGLKLMFAGALAAAAEADAEVVYRELSGEWFSLRVGPAGVLTEPLDIDPGETDDIPVEQLVAAQLEVSEKAVWSQGRAEALDVPNLVRCGIAHGWDWKKTFAAAGLDHAAAPGFLFERFVGAALAAMGVENLVANLQLSADEQALQEIDLAANHGGRLLIVDCKLRSEKEAGKTALTALEQIRQAGKRRLDLGGLGAETLLMRPNWTFSEAELALAGVNKLHVLHRPDAPRLLENLAKFVKAPLPPALAAAQAEVLAAAARGVPAFAREAWSPHVPDASEVATIVPVGCDLDHCRDRLGRQWIAYEVDGQVHVRAVAPAGCTVPALAEAAQRELAQFGKVVVRRSNTGKRFTLAIETSTERRAALAAHLESRMGKSLFSTVP